MLSGTVRLVGMMSDNTLCWPSSCIGMVGVDGSHALVLHLEMASTIVLGPKEEKKGDTGAVFEPDCFRKRDRNCLWTEVLTMDVFSIQMVICWSPSDWSSSSGDVFKGKSDEERSQCRCASLVGWIGPLTWAYPPWLPPHFTQSNKWCFEGKKALGLSESRRPSRMDQRRCERSHPGLICSRLPSDDWDSVIWMFGQPSPSPPQIPRQRNRMHGPRVP